jgi:hypothetical protein
LEQLYSFYFVLGINIEILEYAGEGIFFPSPD